eukprot:6708783-Pyramimonas_sp.AAC.1
MCGLAADRADRCVMRPVMLRPASSGGCWGPCKARGSMVCTLAMVAQHKMVRLLCFLSGTVLGPGAIRWGSVWGSLAMCM